MAYADVQAVGSSAAGTSTTIAATLVSTPTNGNAILVATLCHSSSVTVTGINDGSGHNLSLIKRYADATNGNTVELWGATNASSWGKTWTATFSSTVTWRAICVLEVSGFGSSAISTDQDTGGNSQAVATTTLSTGSSSPTAVQNSYGINVWAAVHLGADSSGAITFSSPSNSYAIKVQTSASQGIAANRSFNGLCCASKIITSAVTIGGTVEIDQASKTADSFGVNLYGPSSAFGGAHLLACLGCGG